MEKRNEKIRLAAAGAAIGLCAFALALLGNPANMGFCIACFVRDIAGSLRMHQASAVQYMRPEIIGLVLGAFIISLIRGEFKPRGGSSPMLRLILGFFVMIGALAFLGCPLRMVIRLAGGDLNALVGLAGFIAGIATGVLFLNKGYSLGKYYSQSSAEGVAMPAVQIVLLVILIAFPSLLAFSGKGPGSMHAAIAVSLAAGLAVGAAAQRTRMCMAGGIRDAMLFGDWTLFYGTAGIFLTILIANLISGKVSLGFSGQPVAHSDHIWNSLGMMLTGLASVMLGGCPMRQLILAGEGNTDSALTVVGMLLGASAAHNFNLAGIAGKGVPSAGRIAVLAGLAFCIALALVKIKEARR